MKGLKKEKIKFDYFIYLIIDKCIYKHSRGSKDGYFCTIHNKLSDLLEIQKRNIFKNKLKKINII